MMAYRKPVLRLLQRTRSTTPPGGKESILKSACTLFCTTRREECLHIDRQPGMPLQSAEYPIEPLAFG